MCGHLDARGTPGATILSDPAQGGGSADFTLHRNTFQTRQSKHKKITLDWLQYSS